MATYFGIDFSGCVWRGLDVEGTVIDPKIKMALIVFVCIVFISSVLTGSISVFLMQIIFSTITIPLIATKPYETARLYIIVFFVAVCFVFVIYMANQQAYGNSYYIGGSEDLYFDEVAKVISDASVYNSKKLLGTILRLWDDASILKVHLAWMVQFGELFTGFTTFMPRIANVYFLLWSAMLFEHFLRRFTNFADKEIRFTIAGFTLTPNILNINSHVFRDTFNLVLIFLILFAFERLMANKRLTRTAASLLVLAVLFYITYYTRQMSVVLAVGLMVIVIISRFKHRQRYWIILLLLLAVLLLAMLSEVLEFETDKVEYYIDTYSQYLVKETGMSNYIFNQPLLPFGIVMRFFYCLLCPFPNFLSLFNDPNCVLLDTVRLLIYCVVVCQIVLIPFILKRLFEFDWLAFSFLLCYLAVVGTTFTFRHVVFYYPFMAALAVDGYCSSSKGRRKCVFWSWAIISSMLGSVYFCFKAFS